MKVNEIKKMNQRTIVYDKRYHITLISLQSDRWSFRIVSFCFFHELRLGRNFLSDITVVFDFRPKYSIFVRNYRIHQFYSINFGRVSKIFTGYLYVRQFCTGSTSSAEIVLVNRTYRTRTSSCMH